MSKLALFGGPKVLDDEHQLKTSWGRKGLAAATLLLDALKGRLGS